MGVSVVVWGKRVFVDIPSIILCGQGSRWCSTLGAGASKSIGQNCLVDGGGDGAELESSRANAVGEAPRATSA